MNEPAQRFLPENWPYVLDIRNGEKQTTVTQIFGTATEPFQIDVGDYFSIFVIRRPFEARMGEPDIDRDRRAMSTLLYTKED
jgi:hypothetical protein